MSTTKLCHDTYRTVEDQSATSSAGQQLSECTVIARSQAMRGSTAPGARTIAEALPFAETVGM